MKLSIYSWRKLISRWAGIGPSPERNLAVEVITQAVFDATRKDPDGAPEPDWMGDGLRYWCKAIAIDPDFLVAQVNRAAGFAAPGLLPEGA